LSASISGGNSRRIVPYSRNVYATKVNGTGEPNGSRTTKHASMRFANALFFGIICVNGKRDEDRRL